MSPLPNPVTNKVILKNYNTPATIAGASPTLDYRFALDKTEIDAVSLTDKLTFSRSATCAFTDSGGNLALAGANVPRFTYNASTRRSEGLLFESSATNLFRRSQQIGTSPWFGNDATITQNSTDVRDPVGGFTSTKMVSTGDRSGSNQSVTIPSTNTYVYSVYLRSGVGNLNNFRFQGSASGATFPSGGFINLTPNWQRFIVVTPSLSSGIVYNISLGFLGIPTNPVYAWGAQFEVGSTVSSYIPTTNAAVTRTETATISLAGLPATRTLVEKPEGCATISGDTLTLNTGYTIERVMVFPVSLTSEQITAIRSVM